MQEYLAEAYRLVSVQGGNPYITTSALAERMNVTAPAVSAVMKRLSAHGLVEHEPYKGMRLTPKGEKEALLSIRRHRIAEIFMVKVMGFDWADVHDDADALGGAISDKMAERMEQMAGYPKRCPHGEPIPSKEGVMPVINDEPLSGVDPVASLIVSRVKSHDADELRYLASLKLVPEQKVKLLSRAPFQGPLRLSIDGNEQVIGAELAADIRVMRADSK
jgi:DtxR family transcriptional regulator, Mn-dependent transcriptional regulator